MNNVFIFCKDRKAEVISKLLEFGYDGTLLTEDGFKESRIISSFEAYLERNIIMIGDNKKIVMVLQKDYDELNSITIAKEFKKYSDDEFLDIPLTHRLNLMVCATILQVVGSNRYPLPHESAGRLLSLAAFSEKYLDHAKICFHDFQVKELESQILEVSDLYRNSGYIVSTIEFDGYYDWYYITVRWL